MVKVYINTLLLPCVEAGFYSDVVECLPVDPATWVQFLAGIGKIFSLYDIKIYSRREMQTTFVAIKG